MEIENILSFLQQEYRESAFNWLDAANIELNGNELSFSFIHPYMLTWFEKNILCGLKELFREKWPDIRLILLKEPKFAVVSRDAVRINQPRKKNVKSQEKKFSLSPLSAQRDLFADFLFNEKNALAVKAATALAQKKIAASFPGILLFYGPPGSGKSHLLKAIQQKRGIDCQEDCLLLSAKQLLSNMSLSFFSKQSDTPKAALVLVDDLHKLENSPAAIELLVNLCDRALGQNERKKNKGENAEFHMVCAMTAENLQLTTLSPSLLSRLKQGLIFDLHSADLDIRLRFAEKFNREYSLGLNRGQLLGLARQTLELSELIGLLRKIEFFVTVQGLKPGARELEKILNSANNGQPSDWQYILEKVAKRLNLKTEDILSGNRKPEYVLARQIAMYLARGQLALSFQEIGKYFGGKDHSTIMHGVKKIQKIRNVDEDMHKLLTELEK